ncbi:GNAT family acetyltransferase [Enterococcus sp. AZ093]
MMEIKEENNRLVLLDDEQNEIGEMTWSDAGPDIMIIDHTFVDPAFRGQKLAEKLVATGVEVARRTGRKVIPLCPYAKAEFERKAEYHDVWRK